MNAFGPFPYIDGGFNFQDNLCIAQDKVHFRTGGGSPERDGEIKSAVMPVGPAFVKGAGGSHLNYKVFTRPCC